MKKLIDASIRRLYYPKEGAILKEISLSVYENDKIVIKGDTGSGKTSLIKLLNRMNEYYEGRIFYKDKDIREIKPETLRSEVVLLPQEPFLGKEDVLSALELPFSYRIHREKELNRDLLKKLMERFYLREEWLAKQTSELSGGEKQRFSLIRAMLLSPEILLLDEPTSALDENTSQTVLNYLLETWKGAIVCVSHSPEWQSAFPRKITINGQTVEIT